MTVQVLLQITYATVVTATLIALLGHCVESLVTHGITGKAA